MKIKEAGNHSHNVDACTQEGLDIRYATLEDLDALVDLHYMSFTHREHLAMLLGRNFIRDIYRWFITSSETFAIAAEVDSRVVGLTTVCDRRYDIAMMQHSRRSAVIGFLKHPWLMLHPEFVKRGLGKLLCKNDSGTCTRGKDDTATLAFIAVNASMRRCGIAKKLLEEAKRTTRKRGKQFLRAGVYKSNTASKLAFEMAGFRERPDLEVPRRIFMEADLRDEN